MMWDKYAYTVARSCFTARGTGKQKMFTKMWTFLLRFSVLFILQANDIQSLSIPSNGTSIPSLNMPFNGTSCRLEGVENGHYQVVSDTEVGVAVRVQCSLGYKLVGPGYHVCDISTGNFTDAISTCKGCDLGPLEYGLYLDVSNSEVGVAVQGACFPGYRLVGEGYRVCNITTGQFTNGLPRCEDINECEIESDEVCDKNAVCINLGGSFHCVCKRGYKKDGDQCIRMKECQEPKSPINGAVRLVRNGVAVYSCAQGYLLLGDEFLYCRDGDWSGQLAYCLRTRKSCVKPDSIENGEVISGDLKPGDIARYFCYEGFVIDGQETRECHESGVWTSSAPTCVKLNPPTVSGIAAKLGRKISSLSAQTSTGRLFSGQANGADIVFMIDRSSSIRNSSLERVKDFIMMVVDELGVNNANPAGGGTRVAILTFGKKPHILFNLNNQTITSKAVVREALDTVEPFGGETALRDAIEMMYVQIAEIADRKSQRALFIIADGQSTVPTKSNTKYYISSLKKKGKKGFEVFVIAVGTKKVIVQDLIKYASTPSRKYFFNLENFADLTKLKDKVVRDKDSPTCGKAGDINQNGELHSVNAEEGTWPWLALVYDEGSDLFRMCGGTLICQDWVLTSALCVKSKKISVELGVYSLLNQDSVKRFPAQVAHRLKNKDGVDLVLLQLTGNFTKNKLGPHIGPICLSDSPGTGRELVTKQDVWIAGFGARPPRENGHTFQPRDVAIYVKLPITKCGEAFQEDQLLDSEFCAGERFGSDEGCRGDIGGPIMYRENGRFRLMGVAKETEHCNKRDSYGRFMEVVSRPIVQWLHNVTEECNLQLQDNFTD